MIRHIVCFRMKEGCSAREARQMLLSIAGGTVVYMLLVQTVF